MARIEIPLDQKTRREIEKLEREMPKLSGGRVDLKKAALDDLVERCRTRMRSFRHPETGHTVKHRIVRQMNMVLVDIEIEDEFASSVRAQITR